MKKKQISILVLITVFLLLITPGIHADAKAADVISNGIFAQNIDLSGMTQEEATQAVQGYVDTIMSTPIVLKVDDVNQVEVLPSDIALTWSNPEIIQDAINLGKSGNVVARYKAIKDLERENKVYDITFSCDKEAIRSIITSAGEKYDVDVVDTSLIKNGDTFEVVPGVAGSAINVEESTDTAYDYIINQWTDDFGIIQLLVETVEPRGTADELSKVKDILGTCRTSYSTSGASRSTNVANGCSLVNGTLLYPGDEFSTYNAIKPFSEENGYELAGSYLNGTVVESLGGGICQVSTTLYNAVLQAELEVTERHNHSMIIAYVQPSFDAAISESAGKDFKFINNTDYPIYIEGITENKKITFTIYGVETRDPNRVVTYSNEVLDTIQPTADQVVADSTQPIGAIDVQAAHTGYKANLWKTITLNGVQQSREQVNSSSYKMVPRIYSVGTASADPSASAAIQAAIATQNMTHVNNVIAALTSADPAIAAQAIIESQTPATPATTSTDTTTGVVTPAQ